MSTVRNITYGTTSAFTITLASLATSSTWVAGRQSTSISNTSTLALDYWISGTISVGTTPTANSIIEVWIIPQREDGTWPDAFGATDANVTVTTRAMLFDYGYPLRALAVDTNTSNRKYEFSRSVRELCGRVPKTFVLWVVHNTGVNFNSTGGNHVIDYTPDTETFT